MRQEISALMDGELFEDEIDDAVERIKRNESGHHDWATYHLIGDILRQPEHIHRDLSASIRERLHDEPTVLAPRHHAAKQRVRTLALSAAASLVAVGVVGWMSLQIAPENVPLMAMKQAAIRPAALPAEPVSDDYLMAHQEFSPSMDMSGGAAYIRTVAYGPEGRHQ